MCFRRRGGKRLWRRKARLRDAPRERRAPGERPEGRRRQARERHSPGARVVVVVVVVVVCRRFPTKRLRQDSNEVCLGDERVDDPRRRAGRESAAEDAGDDFPERRRRRSALLPFSFVGDAPHQTRHEPGLARDRRRARGVAASDRRRGERDAAAYEGKKRVGKNVAVGGERLRRRRCLGEKRQMSPRDGVRDVPRGGGRGGTRAYALTHARVVKRRGG